MNYNRKEQLQAMNRQIKELSGVYRSALSRLGLSENEFWIWYALLIMEEAYSQQDLCDEWSLSKQTVKYDHHRYGEKGLCRVEGCPRHPESKNHLRHRSGPKLWRTNHHTDCRSRAAGHRESPYA